jgi:Zn finger protein HypA/HybF involved in hydrogenase expression
MNDSKILRAENQAFYDLIRPKGVTKNRKCLRCQTFFKSQSAGSRLCGTCNTRNQHVVDRPPYEVLDKII